MVRALAALAFFLLTTAAPAHADPDQYCAHVTSEMQKWSTAGPGIDNCGFITTVANTLCNYWRKNGPYFQKAADTIEPKYYWDTTTAAIVIVYAVNDYCPEFTKYLPQQKPDQMPVVHDEPRDQIM